VGRVYPEADGLNSLFLDKRFQRMLFLRLFAIHLIPWEHGEILGRLEVGKTGPSRGGERGKFSRAPRRLGGPAAAPSLKNTENGVPDGLNSF